MREAEIFGFLGPNGAGKSTTIRLLLGFLHATSGRAEVLGLDIARESEAIRRRTGYLPGGIAFYDNMTGAEQLRYLASLGGHAAPLRDELIERMELSQRDLRRQIRDYSRGMRQKIGIVQAFQDDPELAILDEPTEGLDPLMQRSFYEILEDRRRAGRTIFFSSHILSEVERVCDRVAIVRKGELVALTDVAELLGRRRRRVELRFAGSPPQLAGVPGISDVYVHDDVLTCQLEGDPGPLLSGATGGAGDGPADRAGAPRGGVHGVLRPGRRGRRRWRAGSWAGSGGVNVALFRQAWAANAVRLVVIAAGLVLMGVVMPVMYAAFGQEVGEFVESVPLLAQFSNFGGGDLFSLTGAVAMGFSHPFTLLLIGIMAIAFPALAIAGERDKGTLEVTLSRPISRHGLYLTLFLAGTLFVGAADRGPGRGHRGHHGAGGVRGRGSTRLSGPAVVGRYAAVVAFMALAFAVSVGSDRAGPAIGIPAVFVLLNYLAFAIGSIWPDMRWLQDYSMFNLLKARDILNGGVAPSDLIVMALFAAVFIGLAWYRFPRRDSAGSRVGATGTAELGG